MTSDKSHCLLALTGGESPQVHPDNFSVDHAPLSADQYAVRALGMLSLAERKLSVLVARGDLPEAEQALKLISSKDKALFNVQTLGKCQRGAFAVGL